jgi:hypothetical protein
METHDNLNLKQIISSQPDTLAGRICVTHTAWIVAAAALKIVPDPALERATAIVQTVLDWIRDPTKEKVAMVRQARSAAYNLCNAAIKFGWSIDRKTGANFWVFVGLTETALAENVADAVSFALATATVAARSGTCSFLDATVYASHDIGEVGLPPSACRAHKWTGPRLRINESATVATCAICGVPALEADVAAEGSGL